MEQKLQLIIAELYFESKEYEDDGYEVGKIIEVYDLKQTLRCLIRITEYYCTTRFGLIPENYGKVKETRVLKSFKKFTEVVG